MQCRKFWGFFHSLFTMREMYDFETSEKPWGVRKRLAVGAPAIRARSLRRFGEPRGGGLGSPRNWGGELAGVRRHRRRRGETQRRVSGQSGPRIAFLF